MANDITYGAVINTNDSAAKHEVGREVTIPLPAGRGFGTFRYVQTRVALTAGDPVCLSATSPAKWYVDRTYPASPALGTLGVAPVAVTAAYFTWIQTRGYCPAVTITSATTIIGQPLYGKASGTGAINFAGSSTDANVAACVFGQCASVVTAASVDAYLNCS